MTGKISFILRAISSVGEHHLDRVRVGGSNPSSLIGLKALSKKIESAFLFVENGITFDRLSVLCNSRWDFGGGVFNPSLYSNNRSNFSIASVSIEGSKCA